jgi:periplasmic protein TonB
MEVKKNKGADLEKKKHGIFLFSLVIATGFMLMAFEWASYQIGYSIDFVNKGELIEEEPIVQEIKIVRPQPKTNIPPKTTPPIIDRIKLTTIIDTSEVIILDTMPTNPTFSSIDTLPLMVGDPEPEPTIEIIYDFVEQSPGYEGGMGNMYKELSDNLRKNYLGISGTVYIEFVVEKDGKLTNVAIKRGVHEELDQNALQAVKKLNKWKPGIQNHHEVRVRMVLPINFKVR